MPTPLNYSTNLTGRLLSDFFFDVRLADPNKFVVGNYYSPCLKGLELGTVTLVDCKTITLKDLSNSISYLCSGKPAPYLAKILERYYPGVSQLTYFSILLFHYTERNLSVHQELLKEWWQLKVDQQPNPSHQQYDL